MNPMDQVIDKIRVELMEGTIKQILESQFLVTGKSWVIDWDEKLDRCRLYPTGMKSCSFFTAFADCRGQRCVDHVADSFGLVLYRTGINYRVERSVPFLSQQAVSIRSVNGSCHVQVIASREFTKDDLADWHHYIEYMEKSGKSWL